MLNNSGSKDFPSLKEKLFTPYKKVIKSLPNQRSNNKRKTQENLNKFKSNSSLHYKFQKANCEYFIDNRG